MTLVEKSPGWNQVHWREHRLEPSLGEMISDPIVQALMRRDGVSREDIWRLIEAARVSAGTLPPRRHYSEGDPRGLTIDERDAKRHAATVEG